MVTGQFSESFPPIMDGVALTVRNYVAGLNRTLGPSYAVVPAIPHSRGQQNGGVYRYLSLPLMFRPPYRVGIPQLDLPFQIALRKLKFDLVHAHSPFSAGRLALGVARRRGIPIVATFHSKFRDNFERVVPITPFVDWGIRRIVEFFQEVDEVWVHSEGSFETLREYGYRGDAVVVRNGVDLQPPTHRDRLRAQGERFLRVGPADFLFLYVGQLAWEKNLELLVRSLGALRRMGGMFRMAFVGEGYAAGAMRSMVTRLGLPGCTTFTGVVRDRKDLSSCYARADCLLFPSRYDTNGLVVVEAAAFGVPSLLTPGSAAAEGVEDGLNGFLVADRVEAYSAKLRWLLAHPNAVSKAGAEARHSLFWSMRSTLAEVRERYVRLVRKRQLSGETALALHSDFRPPGQDPRQAESSLGRAGRTTWPRLPGRPTPLPRCRR
jgi:1,2-diacylglycerol 3-alpha-glucosyltransferase